MVSGLPITDPIFTKIAKADFLAADITFLNENVVFEIGYAIGARKRCLLFVNSALKGDRDLASNIGIFDTLGYESYDNSKALAELLLFRTDFSSIPFEVAINHQAPVYIVEPSKEDGRASSSGITHKESPMEIQKLQSGRRRAALRD
jgi:hypothetical protein